MTSAQNDEKSMLKSAQLRLLLANNKKPTVKDIELILEGVNPNLEISNPNYPETNGKHWINSTLLHLAYRYLNKEAYDILIRKGADFNAKNKYGNTVLHEIFDFFCIESISSWWNVKKNQKVSERIPFIVSTLSAHVQYKNSDNPSSAKGLTHFHIACATNNIEAVEFFLRNGVSVNQAVTKAIFDKYFEGYTPLHFAAQFGYYELAKILLNYGAILNLVYAKVKTPLDISVERNIAMIESTMEDHSDIDITSNERIINSFNLLWSPIPTKLSLLSMKSAMQNSKQVEHLLTEGFHDVNQCTSMDSPRWPGYTALHFAAHANIDTVKILLSYGADIEAKNANGVTPFDLCIERYKAEDIADIMSLVPKWQNILLSDGKTKLMDILMAFKDSEGIRHFLNKRDENMTLFVPLDSPLWPGFTVLHLAVLLSERKKCKSDFQKEEQQMVFNPDLTVITECLKQDADVTAKDHRGWTLIHFAFRLEKENCVKLLFQYHHRMINPVDDETLSHLHIACKVENWDLVQKLLWNGADVNVAYKGESPVSCVYPGWTPLHIAVYKQNCEITKLLLKFGADVQAIDRYGFTPIHGLNLDSQEISQMLFSVLDLRDVVVEDLGLSYLHVACLTHNVDAVKRLLDLGVDVNQVIKIENSVNWHSTFRGECLDGDTPLHCTLKSSDCDLNYDLHVTSTLEIVKNLLLERGADMLIENTYKVCPFSQILFHEIDELLDIVVKAFKRNENLRNRAEMQTGVTMLHLACSKVDAELVKELLDNGAEVNAKIHENSTRWSCATPLHVLVVSFDDCWDDFEDVLKLLLDRGADVTLMNSWKHTPLFVAYRKVYKKSDAPTTPVNLMLESQKKFEINPTTIEGISHFHIACHMLNIDVVEKFLEHDVDVNSTIDVFYAYDLAASTPLLLAARTINWGQTNYVKSFRESFSQLKIVDSLIKRGARVNVEDIHGNTPAHYASFGNSSRENLLERLANSDADVNARNLRGETPLELLLKRNDSVLEEVRSFMGCGCILNSFNTFTDDGYVALADYLLDHEDMQLLLFGAFVNSPNLMIKDDMNRTVIHNIVSSNYSRSQEEHYTDSFDILLKFGCDVDEQDSLGRTALHLAAQFRNKEAIAGLLLVGADINITDDNGKTPFHYVFQACSRCDNSNENHDQYAHFDLFEAFVTQVRKLQLCNLDLHESNDILMIETFLKFRNDDFGDEDAFLSELAKMNKLKVEPFSISLADFVSDAAAVIDYPLMSQDKRKAIDSFFRANKSHFQTEFKQAAGIFQLQYRQAVLRRKIIDEAKDSLSMLMKFRLPDICSHIILRLLKNSELQNLISSPP